MNVFLAQMNNKSHLNSKLLQKIITFVDAITIKKFRKLWKTKKMSFGS